MLIAFDLDGTLADLTHRLHFIEKSPKDWDGFFAACADDKPIYEVIAMLKAAFVADHRIEIWSGRSDVVRKETEKWLNLYGIPYELLRMRKAGDHREDKEVKGEWLDALSISRKPDLAFDDRNQVVEMWRSRGVRCCQVAPGDF